MKTRIFLLLFTAALTGHSQPAFTVTGKVMDKETNRPLSFVTITLIDQSTKKTNNTFSDSMGHYSFNNVLRGIYKLSCSFTGYDSLLLAGFAINDTFTLHDDTVFMNRRTIALKEVTVISRKPVLEPLIDGLVYNAGSEPQLAGGSALDVLRKVPLLMVNQNGDINVVASSSVKIFIDDRPAELYGGSVADYLALLPADRIEKVRVITNPSARYDAEGAGAVILIYTKKKLLNNLAGSARITGAIGDYRSSALYGLNLFYKKKKLMLSFVGGFTGANRYQQDDIQRTAGSFMLDQRVLDSFRRKSFNLSFSADMQVDSLNSVNINITWVSHQFKNDLLQVNDVQDINYSRHYSRNIYETPGNSTRTVSLAYSRRFKEEGRELSFLGFYTKRDGKNDYSLVQYEQNAGNYFEEYNNRSANEEWSFQVDYVHPYYKKNKPSIQAGKWETGIKTLFRNAGSQYEMFPYDAVRSGDFSYAQDVYAGYLSHELPLGAWQLRTGMRYEQTQISALFNYSKVAVNPYKNLIPNIIVSRNFKNNNTLSISYTESIQRPAVSALNPAINFSDSLNISKGDPALRPQLNHRVETSYGIKLPANGLLRLTLYGSQANNSIVQVRQLLANGIAQIRWENIGMDRRIGFSANLNLPLTRQLKTIIVLNTNWQEQKVPGLSLYNNGCWLFSSVYLVNNFKKGFTIDGFIMSQTPIIELQGITKVFFPQYYLLSVSKMFWKDKAGISFTMESFLTPQQLFTTYYKTAAFVQQNTSQNSNRVFQLRFTYRFNKNIAETRTRAGSKALAVPAE